MSDADSAASHGRVSKAPSVSHERQPDPVRSKRGRGRKAAEVTAPSALAAKAQKAVDGGVAQQFATPWRGVLMGNSLDDRHTIQALITEVELPRKLIQNSQAQSNSQHDNCRQQRMESSPQIEHMLRYSKQLFEAVPSSAAPLVSCAYRLGKWKVAQKKPRAVLVELTTVSAKRKAFKASNRLRASRICLDEDLTTQQMQQRKGLSSDFLGLKVRGFKPFFRGTTLKVMLEWCASVPREGLTKSGAPAPTVPGPRPAHRPEHINVAMDPTEVLRQAGVSASGEFDFKRALPFTMGVVRSDNEFQDCVSPTASASRHMGACFD
ncbi:TPA: hypothetical protein ACH3X1_008159 [Trebouxia sp. C0004]